MDSIRDVLPRTAQAIAADFAAGQHKGFQIYVSLRDETVADAASGEAYPGAAMTPETLLCWLSSGKPLTAVAVGLLWQSSLLSLDDPVARHVPEFGRNGKEAITIRHLMTHTAGIPNVSTGYPGSAWDESLAAIYVVPVEPDWVVGRTAGYHTASSWFVLGEIVRRLSGQAFENFVHQGVCASFGMDNTVFAVERAALFSLGSKLGWTWGRVGRSLGPLDWHEWPRVMRPSPGSSARGPIRELGRLYESLLSILRGGSGPLTPQTIEAMVSPHRIGEFDRTFQHIVDFGLGFLVNSNRYGYETVPYSFGQHASPRAFGHGGAQSSMGFADPEHELVVAWAANAMIGEPRHNARNRAINTAIYEDLGLA